MAPLQLVREPAVTTADDASAGTGRGTRSPRVVLAAEGSAAYAVSPEPDDRAGAGRSATSSRPLDALGTLDQAVDLLRAIDEAVDVLDAADLDAASTPQLRAELEALRSPLVRLEARRSLLLATIAAREAAAAPEARRERVRRRTQDELGRRQGLTVGESRRAGRAGQAAQELPLAGGAFREGRLSERHMETIARTLDRCPASRRQAVEAELFELAQRLDAHALAREARAIEHRESPKDAERRARFDHARRGLRLSDNRDGGLDVAGSFYGLGAERLRVAVEAFRSFDDADEPRSGEQRNADALVAVADVALRSGEAETNRNIRPQVIVVAQADELADPDGHGRFSFSGEPVRWSQLGSLLGDCVLTGLLEDARGAPIAVTGSVRTVPIGLMKALIARDGGCVWEGCTRPWTQCDVAHGNLAYRDGGRLSVDNAALLCFDHHPRFDAGNHRMRIDGNRVEFDALPGRREVPAGWEAMLATAGGSGGPDPGGSGGSDPPRDVVGPPDPAPGRAPPVRSPGAIPAATPTATSDPRPRGGPVNR